jgi:hypothetical protein
MDGVLSSTSRNGGKVQTDRSRSKSANHQDRKSPYRSQRSLSAIEVNEKPDKESVPT